MEHQQQQAFTFASPISSSETYQDALGFDYQSWIDQSKINNCLSSQQGDKLWMDGHLLHDEAYEMSLRDLSELSLSMAATEEEAVRSKSNNKPKPMKKIPTMERVGLVVKLFMPRAAATGRLQDAISETGNEPSNSQSNRDTKTTNQEIP
jgi:hypothetical protein